jgi:gp16 family phage-associated protein
VEKADLKARVRAAIPIYLAGVTLAEWARREGYRPNTVYRVIARAIEGHRVRGRISREIMSKLSFLEVIYGRQ